MVLASGALVREGLMDAKSAILFCYIGSVLAETAFYLIGLFAGPRMERRSGRFAMLWMRAERRFQERPALTVFLTRWLLVPLGIPTNLLAGTTRYPYWRFALSAMAGDAMWIALYGLTGYFVGHGWQPGRPAFVRATAAPGAAPFKPENWEAKYSLAELKAKGFSPSQPVADLPATLLTLEGAQGTEHWIGFKNFWVITRYNRSPMYAMAVWQLAQDIAGRPYAGVQPVAQ
jgi:membrane protein YqaA with SNARE-associated domain